MQRERQRHRQREKQVPRREPDVGLNPRTPGSPPESKADSQPLSHPGAPSNIFLTKGKIGGFLRMTEAIKKTFVEISRLS